METSGPVQACNGTAFYLFNEPTNAQGKIYYIVCILYYIILYYIILYYIILYYIILLIVYMFGSHLLVYCVNVNFPLRNGYE